MRSFSIFDAVSHFSFFGGNIFVFVWVLGVCESVGAWCGVAVWCELCSWERGDV